MKSTKHAASKSKPAAKLSDGGDMCLEVMPNVSKY